MGLTMPSNQTFIAAPRTARHHFMMYTPRAQAAFQHQQFFFEQKEKLTSLLITVGQDARVATDHQACLDYFELTTVVTQLLEEARLLSTLTFDAIERSGVQMQPFAEKVDMVEKVAAEVRMRSVAVAVAKPVSRKRGRMMDDEEEQTSFAVKRHRNIPADQEMMIEPSFCGPYADRFLQTAWWTQQVCE